MAKDVTLADIAAEFGVSSVTVSKALSGQKGVGEELRERIIARAGEMGYRPRASREDRRDGTSYNIGVLVASRYLGSYDNFYMEMYKQLVAHASAQNCFTVMEIVEEEAERSDSLPMVLKEQRADGVIVIGKMRDDYLRALREEGGCPLLYLDFSNDDPEVDAVISDSYYGAYKMTNYLLSMGHERIGYIGTIMSTASITDRFFGYARAIMEHGIEVKKEWVIDDRDAATGSMYWDGFPLPERLPGAFFCNSDLAASILIRQLSASGIRVPGDVSVAGYDNFLHPGLCDIPLTSYEVDMGEMARRAVKRLIKRMGGDKCNAGLSIVEGRIIPGESVREASPKVGAKGDAASE